MSTTTIIDFDPLPGATLDLIRSGSFASTAGATACRRMGRGCCRGRSRVGDGNGEVQLAANNTLAVRIPGVGHVRYHGSPAVTRSIQGIGSIEKD